MSQLVGAQAPDFTLPLLSSGTAKLTLSEVSREHPVLLVFWASWCPSCVEEIPVLNDWYREWTPKGLKILGINVEEPRSQLSAFVKAQPIDYPVLLDEKGEVAEHYGLVGLPAAVVLAKGGKIIYYGFTLPRDMQHLLNKGARQKNES